MSRRRRGGRKDWRAFEEAREYARSLDLKNKEQWVAHCKFGQKPDDIPADTYGVYKGIGWISWRDFLGTSNVRSGEWRPFAEAREFARGLGLKSIHEWREYVKTSERPDDIPTNPNSLYKSEWTNWGDFLGTGNVRNREWRPFAEAREFARGLGLHGQIGWREYCRSGEKPVDIPSNADAVYKAEWTNWGDWLGTGNVHPHSHNWRPFEEAREFARGLGFKSGTDWRRYVDSGEKPDDIPAGPESAYRGKGWAGWGDFLGTGNKRPKDYEWRPFEEAREHVRSLGLKTTGEWTAYTKSADRPDDIPAYPREVYEDQWVSMGDWLGTGYVATFRRKYRPFEEARAFVRTLGLKNIKEWEEYCRSGKKPDDIPSSPWVVYGNKWKGP